MPKRYNTIYSNIDRIAAIVCIFSIVYQYLSYDMFKIGESEIGLYNIKDSDENISQIDTVIGCNNIGSVLTSKDFDICKYFQFLPIIQILTLGLLLTGLIQQLRIIGLVSGLLAFIIGVIELLNFDNIKEKVCIAEGDAECKDTPGFSYYLIYVLLVAGGVIMWYNLATFEMFGGSRINPYSFPNF